MQDITNDTKNSNPVRGGARPGAGRKKKEPKKQGHFYLSIPVLETLKTVPNQSEYVEKAVVKQLKKDKIQINDIHPL